MKLRERFEKLEDFDEDKCVKIAENFAIHFALWISYNYIISSDGIWIDCKNLKKLNTIEIMEVFNDEYYN